MKKLLLSVTIILGISFTVNAQKVNEKVKVESKGAWYDATILKVNDADGTYYIKYDGWDDSWNEWVGKDRMKDYAEKQALTKFKVGDMVEVEYGMVPEPAKVIEVGENKYKIQYEKSAFGTKWVTERQMKKL